MPFTKGHITWNKGKKGFKQSLEQCLKLSARMKGNKYQLGKKKPESIKLKQSILMKNRFASGELVQWNKGLKGVTKFSEEQRRHMSLAKMGHPVCKEAIEKMAALKRGVKQSKEYIMKRMINNPGLFKKGHKINLGKKYSPERIMKARLARKDFSKTPEQINKQRDSMLQLYKTHPELREKIRQTNKKYIQEHPEERLRLIEMRKNVVHPKQDTKIEIKIQDFLKQLGIEYFTHQYIKQIAHGYQCDIFIPIMNMVIECDGTYWHNYPTGRDIDHIRTKELMEKGFKVLRLWEFEIKEMDVNGFKQKIMEFK